MNKPGARKVEDSSKKASGNSVVKEDTIEDNDERNTNNNKSKRKERNDDNVKSKDVEVGDRVKVKFEDGHWYKGNVISVK